MYIGIPQNNKDKDYHYKKTLQCKKKGIQLLHFWDYELIDKYPLVLSMIKARIGLAKISYARKLLIIEPTKAQVGKFLDKNHLQGYCHYNKAVALIDEDEIKCIMTFGKPRFNSNYEWELIRFCNKRNNVVVGGASRLLHYFEEKFKPNSLLSYADLRYSYGNMYKKLGLGYSHRSVASYSYFKNNQQIISRYKAQKHKLFLLLGSGFNKSLSEATNMLNNGYLKIYDCGNLVYSKVYP